ncbi:HET-domain-containing protein [Diaporthe amygdali]|uniref:HET-domain-containing protein n=1 Tax=Phomopsis amygdali TaxID=1214568 RepID=UPI0022FE32DA|nr:HET-domain-containing protein [Diaporthe amygdali]KAJ0122253.1 HET-domain-containing protein [Diaporthe amygdali]
MTEPPEESLTSPSETNSGNAGIFTQDPSKAYIAEQDSKLCSNALIDVIHSGPTPILLLSQDILCNEDALVGLNRFCYFCQQLCEASRVLNTHVHEEDGAIPTQEPSGLGDHRHRPFGMPHRQIREYFDFWPSTAEMLSSARNGCHLCSMMCQEFLQTLHNYHGSAESFADGLSTGFFQLDRKNLDSSAELVEGVLSYGPLKLVVCWTWWLPSPKPNAFGSASEAMMTWDLYIEWPSKGSPNNYHQDPPFLGPRHSMYLRNLCVDAMRTKEVILSELQASDDYHYRKDSRTNIVIPRDSPKLGTGKDHLLSHYTGSEAVMNMANRWISACHKEHSCREHPNCATRDSSFRPTRLLDVGDPSSIKNPRLNIKENDAGPVQYLALSHCWGTNVKSFYMLTKETEAELARGVHIETLSQTFQDAVKVCRKLKKRYIWIDSLCIRQDDPDDWLREAAQMHLVYANSYCTIAAVCASSGGEGFLRSRNPRLHQACNFPTKIWASISGLSHRPEELRACPPEPLFSRAWTLQERLLSPRILKFGEEAISWECQECELTEDGREPPSMRNAKIGISHAEMMQLCTGRELHSNPMSQSAFLFLWRKLLSAYTEMALTQPADRPFAFQGITSHIARLSSKVAGDGGEGTTFFDGLPIAGTFQLKERSQIIELFPQWEPGPESEPMDMSGVNQDGWQPNSAAGIVLIRSQNREDSMLVDQSEEVHTRIGYWELEQWNQYHPPYGLIREEAEVRRIVII